jgi:hypothetical protein
VVGGVGRGNGAGTAVSVRSLAAATASRISVELDLTGLADLSGLSDFRIGVGNLHPTDGVNVI